jgi:hypothetical protein
MTSLRTLAAAALVVAARPAGADPFAPGEETVLQFRFLNVPSGEGRITVGQPAGEVWPVIFQARTEGVAGFFDIREHLVSYWDRGARLPRGSDLRAYEVGDFKVERTRFDRVNGKATHEKQRNGKRSVSTFDVPSGVHDLTSAFMWLRHQPLQPGDRHDVPVCSGSRQFTLVAEVLARETIETAAGTFPTVKVKVRTAFEGKFSTKRDTFLWVSDDARHVLVRMSADFAVGSLVATLRSYRPGTEVAAR